MVTLRFYEELNRFLPDARKKHPFQVPHHLPRSVKDLIESLGVPHVEVDLILVNGTSVDFTFPVHDGDYISVYPVFERLDITDITRLRPRPLRVPRFIADVHLKTLARKLRMLGFDTLYNPEWDDPELARRAGSEDRILLTRDRGLLMRSIVSRGIAVSSSRPSAQLSQVVVRLDLYSKFQPFCRCIRCNTPLEVVSIESLKTDRSVLPPDVLEHQTTVSHCTGCGRLYWKGSHLDRMQAEIDLLLKKRPEPRH